MKRKLQLYAEIAVLCFIARFVGAAEIDVASPVVSYHFFDTLPESSREEASAKVSYIFEEVATGGKFSILDSSKARIVREGESTSFNVLVGRIFPVKYQWYFNGDAILGATASTFTLTTVRPRDSGAYSVAVYDVVHSLQSHAAFLAVLGNPLADGTPRNPATFYPPSVKKEIKDSLVIVTHGFQQKGDDADVSWLDEMVRNLRNTLPNNWQVEPHKWLEAADSGLVLSHAKSQGAKLGQEIAEQSWAHIHLIGHSAGSKLIQVVSEIVKASPKSENTVVHTTFLDPYLGVAYQERTRYGSGADWSDSYYVRDFTGARTEVELPSAFNVDITGCHKDAIIVPKLCGGYVCGYLPYLPSPLLDLWKGHAWAHEFYNKTIIDPEFSSEYGFARSKEGGGWEQRSNYGPGNGISLSPETPMPLEPAPPVKNYTRFVIDDLPFAGSDNGDVLLTSTAVRLSNKERTIHSASIHSNHAVENAIPPPVWASFGITVSNFVNFVSFDATFLSTTNAAGLVSVYWNTNQIGFIDERVAFAGVRSYDMELPQTYSNGVYSLSFRLDAFTNQVSLATISNVSLGMSGFAQPISLDIGWNQKSGIHLVSLTGQTGDHCILLGSTNLVSWMPLAFIAITNSLSRVDFGLPTNRVYYYRAVSR